MAVSVAALLQGQVDRSSRPSVTVAKEDDLDYDLGRLSAFDSSPVDEVALRNDPAAYLLRTARENTQLLTNKMYELLAAAKSKGEIRLPPPTIPLPREKPLPQAKATTRWEKFAQEKGIVKKKRSKMVWDETAKKWAPRFGYGRANDPNDKMKNWMVESKPGDTSDPFETKAEAGKESRAKQKRQEDRNRLEAAHAAGISTKGTVAGAATSSLGGNDRKQYLSGALAASQGSTASAGRFDKQLDHEPSKNRGKRKQYESATQQGAGPKDAARTESVVSKLFPEHKPSKVLKSEKAAKQARLAEEKQNRTAKLAKAASRPAKAKAEAPGSKSKGAHKKGKK